MKAKPFVKHHSQASQVIEAMRNEGGYATLRRLNEIVDFSSWTTKTPEATVRRIVQQDNSFFKIQPGLWALEEMRDEVLRKFEIKPGDMKSVEVFTHGYYQGILVEIGKYEQRTTYVPAQDNNRKFMEQPLGKLADTTVLPHFTYDNILRKAKTVDVIWFNERQMPSAFYEVEHTSNIKNSLSKFYELQDFHANFYIVADKQRESEFNDKIQVSMFRTIEKRVKFLDYDRVVKRFEGMKQLSIVSW
ncbi:MAG: hypothetical protein KIG84_07130 [Bacteroidales bacterium]|nr:hypothetical protein [Bacteroidales bacterium]